VEDDQRLQQELKKWKDKAEREFELRQRAEKKLCELETCLENCEIELCRLTGIAGFLAGLTGFTQNPE
jgi:hypothetical protein